MCPLSLLHRIHAFPCKSFLYRVVKMKGASLQFIMRNGYPIVSIGLDSMSIHCKVRGCPCIPSTSETLKDPLRIGKQMHLLSPGSLTSAKCCRGTELEPQTPSCCVFEIDCMCLFN